MIFFRADANKVIGMGHIMRCLSIAAGLKKQGYECSFLTAEPFVKDIAESRGFACTVLTSAYNALDNELPLIEPVITDAQAIFVDSYFVTPRYLGSLSKKCKVIYIDDIAAFAYPVAYLINYNIYADENTYKKIYADAGIPCPTLLTGTKYAPLRDEFQSLQYNKPAETVKNILVSTGGADPLHTSLQFLKKLHNTSNFDKYTFHLVIGAANPDLLEIKALAAQIKNVKIHQNVKNMHMLMTNCDIAVSAAGSTLYELCASSMPIITYVIADNQIMGAQKFADLGVALFAGDARSDRDFMDNLFNCIAILCNDKTKRSDMAKAAYGTVDGKGVERLTAALI